MAARSDRTSDPALRDALLLARRGQAYFSRKLNELRNDELDAPSLVPGWSRRHVVAHVGFNARALTRLTEWAATGVETPMYASTAERDAEIELGATLPARALRNLSAHAAVHLDVEWRDLTDEAWGAQVRTAQGRVVPASETVWMRTREVWIHAVDLANGASFRQFPAELVDGLLADVARVWSARLGPSAAGVPLLCPTDRAAGPGVLDDVGDGTLRVHGRAADLARWATGRGGARALTTDTGAAVPEPPRWL